MITVLTALQLTWGVLLVFLGISWLMLRLRWWNGFTGFVGWLWYSNLTFLFLSIIFEIWFRIPATGAYL